jgi:branched-chain amino acid aminotransferase
MSAPAPLEPAGPADRAIPEWLVRDAREDDLAAVAASVAKLLVELGATPPAPAAMLTAARALLADPAVGAILVAEADGEIVGVLAASWQLAIHAPGRYALIQDLWVHPEWRGRTIGRDLLAALVERARGLGMAYAEVGLPRERFAGLSATEAFYRRHDFDRLGVRMRRGLS